MRHSTIIAASLLLFGQCILFSQIVGSNEPTTELSVDNKLLTKDRSNETQRTEQRMFRKRFRKWKRSIHSRSTFQLWKMPIYYKFDGQHTTGQRQVILGALQHWMENTCIRFQEISSSSSSSTEFYSDHHIIFTRQPLGCFSYTGMVKKIPQQVNLDDDCLQFFGKAVHEIGHVIGLSHEHQRTDRDDSVVVVEENIGKFRRQFQKHWEVPREIPYELGSVMHYSAKDGSVNGGMTLRAKDPLYQGNMGQRTGLAFSDILYANTLYCKDECSGHLGRPCANGGYRDPKSCTRCRCPDGFSGDFCHDIDIGACGGIYHVTVGNDVTIALPGYDNMTSYVHHTSCNWWFKCPPGHKLQLKFVDKFGIFCLDESCYHWVEVRFGENLAIEGPRFCCYSRPDVQLTSKNDQMLVLFRSNWDTSRTDQYLSGFKATVTAVPDISEEELPTNDQTDSITQQTSVSDSVDFGVSSEDSIV